MYALALMMLALAFAPTPALAVDDKADIVARAPRRFVLAIGINRYDDPFWQTLQFASKDARDVHDFFTEKAGNKFDGGELVSTDATGRVTTADVWAAIARLKSNNLREDDVFIVYVSTHGTIFTKKGKGGASDDAAELVPYFVTSDTDHLRIHDTAIERDALIDAFQGLKSQKKALIIAACHSGGGKARLTPQIELALSRQKGGPVEPDPIASGTGYLVLSASSWSEAAMEDVKLGNDVYTHFLLQGQATLNTIRSVNA